MAVEEFGRHQLPQPEPPTGGARPLGINSDISGGGPGEVISATAKAADRRRLGELEAEGSEAAEWGESERADRARVEAEAIPHRVLGSPLVAQRGV